MPQPQRPALDHAATAERLLVSVDTGALPPSLRVSAAQAHALLALLDHLQGLEHHYGQAALHPSSPLVEGGGGASPTP